ncbi:nitrate- and nitrite sensing domain-containing protein [Kitasatospora kazusensis]|uniref:histidine kinase n=1 Tax=Kitasatospora kazusensis TaxID=407974 RepID=A0ABP5LBG2_9ACTN
MTTGQTLSDFRRQAAQGLLAQKAGQPSNIVYYNLQEERRLSAQVLAGQAAGGQGGSGQSADAGALQRQRKLTDQAIQTFQDLSRVAAKYAPAEVRDAVAEAQHALTELPAERTLVDQGGSARQADVYTYYTDLIAVDLRLFTALSHVDDGEVTWVSRPLVDLFWTKEMISRTDALLARGWPSGRLGTQEIRQVQLSVSAQTFLIDTKIAPYLPPAEASAWRDLAATPAWKSKSVVEQSLLQPSAPDASGTVALGPYQDQWRQAVDQLNPLLVKVIEARTAGVVSTGKGKILSLLLRVVLTSVIGLLAVIAVILTTWRLTRSLRRRIVGLHDQAQELERTLPEVVERLAQGEQVDVEAEARAIDRGTHDGGEDELTRLGEALNLARTSALHAAVRQADQHRGFERLLQRIARRTQLLIGLQLKKLDELERRYEDPEVLDGLFDLDHLTARLRRYEENLVILAGGTPHRRWRKPVPLLDVLRAAQGEVQDYRRVVLDVEGSPWLSERVVGPVAHVLAELMENALSFSKPPTPVEVRAAQVGRGLAIEVEDRGLGMDEDQLRAANELMSSPPRMDVLARADDIRLGFYVIARLAAAHGLRIEFRPSAFGGTRAVLLVPDELVSSGESQERPARPVMVQPLPTAPAPVVAPATTPALGAGPGTALPSRSRGRALAGVTAQYAPQAVASQADVPTAAVESSAVELPDAEAPLPQRVRQAHLAAELRLPEGTAPTVPRPPRWDDNPLLRPAPRRAGAAIGAFQRRSRAAREETRETAWPPAEPTPPQQYLPEAYLPEQGLPGQHLPAPPVQGPFHDDEPWHQTPTPTTEDRS